MFEVAVRLAGMISSEYMPQRQMKGTAASLNGRKRQRTYPATINQRSSGVFEVQKRRQKPKRTKIIGFILQLTMEGIACYLKTKKYPKHITSNCDKRNFRRLCKTFTLDEAGQLVKNGLRVINADELERVLESVHAQVHGGHLGINKT